MLSLFFIDHVESYRLYGQGGTSNGKFAEMFEEEYIRVVEEMQPTFTDEAYMRYLSLQPVSKTHNGYFLKTKRRATLSIPRLKKRRKKAVTMRVLTS